MNRMAMVFPGQGSQHVGMGAPLYEASAAARALFEEAGDWLGMDAARLCCSGTMRELARVDLMQVAILTVSAASFAAYMEQFGRLPDLAAGHSLGEYSALTCSGALSFRDALSLVKLRGELALQLVEQGSGHMMIVQEMDEAELLQLCSSISAEGSIAAPACLNSQRQTVVAGSTEGLGRLEEALWERGIVTTPLYNSAPFHTPLMRDASMHLHRALASCGMRSFRFPVISGVTAEPYQSPDEIGTGLREQLVRPIQWRGILQYLETSGVSTVIEMGPQSVLSMMSRENRAPFVSLAYSAAEDRKQIVEQLKREAGTPFERPYHFIEHCLGIAASTKNHNHHAPSYEAGVVQSYERLELLADEVDASGQGPTLHQMRIALELLQIILETKGVPVEERESCFIDLFDKTGTATIFQEETDAQPKLARIVGSG